MGYGDLNFQNPDSKIPTPYLDQLASEGMLFTDSHSSSGICSPSRFALLTGTYHWRRQHNIVTSFGKPFFNESDITLPQVLRENGYSTAIIGKWHLGWDWEFIKEPSLETMLYGGKHLVYQPQDIDWSKPIAGGPLDRGFDYYFGDGTINFPPYAWISSKMRKNLVSIMVEGNGYEVIDPGVDVSADKFITETDKYPHAVLDRKGNKFACITPNRRLRYTCSGRTGQDR